MSEWQTVTLKEAGVTLIDCDHKTPKAQSDGLPYIGIPQLKEGRIILDSARLITEDDFHHWRRKAKPTSNDVILSRRCNPGETAYVPEGLEIALGQNLVLLRSDGVKLYPPFLRWVVQGTNWWNQVGKFLNVGAVFDSLKCADIPKFEIQLPPMESQVQISEILGSIDRKIELNTQTNQTLEQIAQAIFKSWFVDFEPVKAKMAVLEAGGTAEQAELAAMSVISAKDETALKQLQAEQPDAYTELAQTAALFPSAMVESELGEIPEGWSISNLKSLSEKISKGTTPRKPDITKAIDPSIVPFIKVKDISDDGEINRGGLENIPLSIHENALKRSILTTDDLLFSIAGTIGRVSIVDDDLDNSNTNQAVAFVRLSDKESFLELCFLTLKSKRVREEIKSKVVQGVQANASLTNIGDIQVVVPDDAVLKAWKKIIYPFISEKRNLSGLNRKLSSLRDTLLPKLLSGELTIPNTEEA